MSQLGEFQSHGQGGENAEGADRGKGSNSPLYGMQITPNVIPLFFFRKTSYNIHIEAGGVSF